MSACGIVVRAVDSKRYHKAGDAVLGRVLASGYRQYKLVSRDGIRVHVRANRLVLETFSGPAPCNKHHAAHNNGNRLDNRLDNLRWATAKENCADQTKHGTKRRGDRVKNARLTDQQVLEIRQRYTGKRGEIRALGNAYGIANFSTIQRIVTGKTYSHLPGYSALERR